MAIRKEEKRKPQMKARFEKLYRTYRDAVYNYLYYMCREEELAQDLA